MVRVLGGHGENPRDEDHSMPIDLERCGGKQQGVSDGVVVQIRAGMHPLFRRVFAGSATTIY